MKKNVAYLGVFLALALVFSYIESLMPIAVAVPGVKIGIANIVIVLVLYLFGHKDALLVSILRVILAGFLFGNMFAIIYGLCGALLSLAVMIIIRKTKQFHVISVSAAGGIAHNLGQVIVASRVVQNYSVMNYFAALIIAGTFTGIVIGIISNIMIKRIGPIVWRAA